MHGIEVAFWVCVSVSALAVAAYRLLDYLGGKR